MKQNDPAPFFQPAILPAAIKALHEQLINAADTTAANRAALAIIKEYHGFFGATGMRPDMWLLLSTAMSNTGENNMTAAAERYNLFFFYEFTLLLMDAVYVLHGEERFGKLV